VISDAEHWDGGHPSAHAHLILASKFAAALLNQ